MNSIGKYRVLEDLGPSATGHTYRTRDTFRNREFAVKILKAIPNLAAEAKERFCAHMVACAELSHRHIARIHDLGEIDEGVFIATEWRSGTSLREFMQAHQDLPLDQKLALIAQIAEGLAFAHSRGIAHGNLKPSNVFVDAGRDVAILDFGTANWLETMLHSGSQAEGLVANYLAPEQILDQPFDARSDIFALGIILYEFAGGRYPFSADAGVIPREIVHTEPAPLRQVFAQIPEALEQLVIRAITKDPEHRLQTADELASGLYLAAQQVRRGSASLATPQAPPVEPVVEQPSEHQLPPALTPVLTPTVAVTPEPASPSVQRAVPMALDSPISKEPPVNPGPVRKRPQDTEQEPRPWTARSYATTAINKDPVPTKEVPAARPAQPTASTDPAKQPQTPPSLGNRPLPPLKATFEPPAYEPPQSFLMPPLQPDIAEPPQPANSKMMKGVFAAGIGLILAAIIVSSIMSRQNLKASQTKGHVATKASDQLIPRPLAKPTTPSAASIPESTPSKGAESAANTATKAEPSAKQTISAVRWLWETGRYARALALVDQMLAADPTNEEAHAWRKKIRDAQAAEAALK